MEKRVERLRYDVDFSPPGDGDCFYASAAKAPPSTLQKSTLVLAPQGYIWAIILLDIYPGNYY